jgi:hypothetical protein
VAATSLLMSNLISMDDQSSKSRLRDSALRNRRYAIRYPFAADAELLELASGTKTEGVTSDVSLGGCFVCTSKPLAVNSRVRITLKRKDLQVEAYGVVRIVKPRIGMGVEFIDVEESSTDILERWVEELRRSR